MANVLSQKEGSIFESKCNTTAIDILGFLGFDLTIQWVRKTYTMLMRHTFVVDVIGHCAASVRQGLTLIFRAMVAKPFFNHGKYQGDENPSDQNISAVDVETKAILV
jgi:hypothetical protein